MGHNIFSLHHNTPRVRRDPGAFPSPALLIFSCLFLYTAMMATKSVYLAEIAYLMEIFEVDKASASMANTYYFVAYASMQVALFCFVSKIDVRKYVIFTAPISAVAIILMGVCEGMIAMRILFALAGLFQAGVYSSANYVLTHYLPTEYLTRANTVMSFGFAIGTVIAYGISAVFVRYDLWRVPFFISGGMLIAAVILFAICSMKAREVVAASPGSSQSADTEEIPLVKIDSVRTGVVFYTVSVLVIFLSGVVYYAVMNWISTLLVEVYEMSQDISIYITTLAPLLITIGPVFTIRSCDRYRNFVRVALVYFLFAIPLPLLLAFFYDKSALLAFLLCAAFVILVNGVKTLAMTVTAFKLRRELNTARFSAIANAAGSLSAAIAPTVIGKIIDLFDWSVAYFTVFGLSLLLAGLLALTDLAVRKKSAKTATLPEN